MKFRWRHPRQSRVCDTSERAVDLREKGLSAALRQPCAWQGVAITQSVGPQPGESFLRSGLVSDARKRQGGEGGGQLIELSAHRITPAACKPARRQRRGGTAQLRIHAQCLCALAHAVEQCAQPAEKIEAGGDFQHQAMWRIEANLRRELQRPTGQLGE